MAEAAGGMFDGLLVKEAVGSVAMSHDDGCDCDICLAASGDGQAFGRVLMQVNNELARREQEG